MTRNLEAPEWKFALFLLISENAERGLKIVFLVLMHTWYHFVSLLKGSVASCLTRQPTSAPQVWRIHRGPAGLSSVSP